MIRNRVTPGRGKVLADEYNAFLRNLRKPERTPGGPVEELYPPLICYVRNDTAFTCDAFTVLGLNGPVITRAQDDVEFRNSITFKGVTPDSDDHEGKYCILQEPIKSGEIGRAVMSGVTWAQLNITDVDDTHAEIANGVRSSIKTSGSGSAKILYKENGTGTNKWGLVYLYATPATPKVAWLNTLRTSYTYTGGGSEKELQFTSPLNASDGTMDLLETVASSGYYTKIELSEPGIYETCAHCSFDAATWIYSTADYDLSSALDQVSMRIETKDNTSNEVSTTANKTQSTTIISGYKFSLSCGGVMNLASIAAALFPVTVRVLVQSNIQDFTANASSGTFWVQKIRDRLDD